MAGDAPFRHVLVLVLSLEYYETLGCFLICDFKQDVTCVYGLYPFCAAEVSSNLIMTCLPH